MDLRGRASCSGAASTLRTYRDPTRRSLNPSGHLLPEAEHTSAPRRHAPHLGRRLGFTIRRRFLLKHAVSACLPVGLLTSDGMNQLPLARARLPAAASCDLSHGEDQAYAAQCRKLCDKSHGSDPISLSAHAEILRALAVSTEDRSINPDLHAQADGRQDNRDEVQPPLFDFPSRRITRLILEAAGHQG